MRKFRLLLAFVPILFVQCSFDSITDKTSDSNKLFPAKAEQYGKIVAENIRTMVSGINNDKSLNQLGRGNVSFSQISNYSHGFLKAKGYSQDVINEPTTEELICRVNSLTEVQKSVLAKISEASKNSKSCESFLSSLLDINAFIAVSVPEIEQERMYHITATLYYGLAELNKLRSEGLLSPVNRSLKVNKRFKTSPNEITPTQGSISSWCSGSGLSTVWLVAVAEPTPVGELVATGATVVYGGYLLYQFVVKCTSNSSTLSREACIDKWYECQKNMAPHLCTECYNYCIGQGRWDCPRPH